jgi:hypothetical protein
VSWIAENSLFTARDTNMRIYLRKRRRKKKSGPLVAFNRFILFLQFPRPVKESIRGNFQFVFSIYQLTVVNHCGRCSCELYVDIPRKEDLLKIGPKARILG